MPETPTAALDDIAAEFMTLRAKLYAIAYRALGSPWSADDAVQETWMRLQRSDARAIANLEAWLTTVVSRVCIDMIRQQVRWKEDLDDDPGSNGGAAADTAVTTPASDASDPFDVVMRAEDLAVAMQVVLDTLGPLERLALVLHDVFALSYDDIAPIVERTPVAARQMASRARARLRGVDVAQTRERQDAAIGAFLDAARKGDFGRLLQLLDPDIELRSDEAAVALAADGAEYGAPLLDGRVNGADAVARVFAGRAELARLVSIENVPAAGYVTGDTIHAVYLVTFSSGRIVALDVLADPTSLSALSAEVR